MLFATVRPGVSLAQVQILLAKTQYVRLLSGRTLSIPGPADVAFSMGIVWR